MMRPRNYSAHDVAVIGAVILLIIMPLIASDFFVDFVMTKVLILGIAASTLIFLSAYGGMVSLAQWLIFGVAGFAVGNIVAVSGHGMKLGGDPWLAIPIALAVATLVALALGALAARSTGIYFLMLTLVYAVIGFFFFAQVLTFSAFGGVTGVDPPPFFQDEPTRIYYAAVLLSVFAYAGFRAIIKTPFGLSLQGVRDDPVRMASLGFNVQLHRMLAFTLAGFVAALGGILFIWWRTAISPQSIDLGPTLDLLIIAVIGGIAALEGAWLGAFVFVGAEIYLRDIPLIDALERLPLIGDDIETRILAEARFNTVIGILLLLIMVLSPDGLAGIISRLWNWLRRLIGRQPPDPSESAEAAQPAAQA